MIRYQKPHGYLRFFLACALGNFLAPIFVAVNTANIFDLGNKNYLKMVAKCQAPKLSKFVFVMIKVLKILVTFQTPEIVGY